MSLLFTYVLVISMFGPDNVEMLRPISSAFAGYGCENDQGVIENYSAVCTYAGGAPKSDFPQVVGSTVFQNKRTELT